VASETLIAGGGDHDDAVFPGVLDSFGERVAQR
jgi:hypothetical protein